MLISNRCTVCHEDTTGDEGVRCGPCEVTVHDPCLEYERAYNCPECADERVIGAVEF